MGCSNSKTVHPSIHNERNKGQGHANGQVKENITATETNSRNIKGDYSQYQLAKHNREKQHKQRQIKLFMAADEMAVKVMESREMLSLGTRSRGTSRNTSRATSPTNNKRNQQQKDDPLVPMTPVAEDKLSRGTSLRSIDKSQKKKRKSNKQSKGKNKSKKHRKGKKSKKGKGKALTTPDNQNSDSDSGLENDTENEAEQDETDSDLENDQPIITDNRSQIENQTEVKNSSNTSEKNETSLPLTEPNGVKSDETPLISNRSVRDIKIQSASKDSGIAESGINDQSNQSGEAEKIDQGELGQDILPEVRSDSRI
ncbi:GATOR complex protein WDR24-like [Ruditapes philippinarum]|uniref:GATOR complex protein WDR24-like n=1 Tax=Ruditapes philippinarum TaxID=129788 RepID=UPI00295A58BC|nr:GATOR complex protein WDR24-like [Ruditapes philippinarum]